MSAPLDSQNFESYVPVYDVAPESMEDLRGFIVEQFKRHANAINLREIGFFLDQELLSGKAFIPGANNAAGGSTSQAYRTVLRKVINFGALPNAGTKSVPHEITFDANFTLVQMFASATDPVAFIAFPLPYADPINILNAVALTMDATNVNITTGINYSSFTRCFVVIEYM